MFFLKSLKHRLTLLLFMLISFTFTANGQSIRLLGGDLLNGTVNGAALGAATMALQNASDRGPLRVGVGLGIIYGLGTGIYDNSIISKGQQFYKSGTFNDAHNSTIITLLDTFYGAAGGAALGGAIALIGNNPVLDGLQYGSGAGAWIGFGFGLIDSFVLAEGPDKYQAYHLNDRSLQAPGLVQLSSSSKKMSLGLIHPAVFARKVATAHQIQNKYSLNVQVLNMRVNF